MPSRKPSSSRRSSAPDSSTRTRARAGSQRRAAASTTLVFERHNYVLLLIGLALVVVGYIVMRVDNQVDGFLSLYVAPLLILGGYMEVIYAIMWRPKPEEEEVIVVEVEG